MEWGTAPSGADVRLTREWHRLTFLRCELRALVADRRALSPSAEEPVVPIVQRLLAFRGVGEVSAWRYTTKFVA